MYPLKFPLKHQINMFNAFFNGIIVRKKLNSAAKNWRLLNGSRICMFDKYSFGDFLRSFTPPSIQSYNTFYSSLPLSQLPYTSSSHLSTNSTWYLDRTPPEVIQSSLSSTFMLIPHTPAIAERPISEELVYTWNSHRPRQGFESHLPILEQGDSILKCLLQSPN